MPRHRPGVPSRVVEPKVPQRRLDEAQPPEQCQADAARVQRLRGAEQWAWRRLASGDEGRAAWRESPR